MKNLFLGITLLLSSATYAAAPTYDEMKDYINNDVSSTIDIINRVLTKLNITSCSQIRAGRPDDNTTIRADHTEVGKDSYWEDHGPSGDNTWDGVINNYSIRFSYETPSATSLALGLEKRIIIRTQDDYHDYAPIVSDVVGMIVEFSCDMKKGHYFSTGTDGATTSDMREVYWDNTSTSVVEYKYAGPVKNTPIYFSRNSSNGKISAAVISTNTFASLSELLPVFGIHEYTLNVDTGVATMN